MQESTGVDVTPQDVKIVNKYFKEALKESQQDQAGAVLASNLTWPHNARAQRASLTCHGLIGRQEHRPGRARKGYLSMGRREKRLGRSGSVFLVLP